MKYSTCFSVFLFLLFLTDLTAQTDARMLRYPDVSATHITFTYASDIWIVSKNGGTANKLSSPAGTEAFARFSPDGKQIAFTGNYDGNSDIYVIPTIGGSPKRLTYHGAGDRCIDWTPDGKNILFSSARTSERQFYGQMYTVSAEGGMATKLPMPYAEFGSYNAQGDKIVYTYQSRLFRTWKRYRGGSAADIWIFDLNDFSSENISNNAANDELPMWHQNTIYYLSDRGPENRYNIWAYDLTTKQDKQITQFSDFDVTFPAIGPADIVFEAGGKLYLLNLATQKHKEVQINVITDQMTLSPQIKKVSNLIRNSTISPDGKRVILEARGELFSIPAEHGYVKNLSATSGVAERSPAWSPDGKSLAYWSDRSGEYELTIKDLEKGEDEEKLTNLGAGFRYSIYWSPDGKKLAWIDNTMTMWMFDKDSKQKHKIDQGLYMYEWGLRNFSVSWSSDSRWIAYARGTDNRNRAIFIYDTKNHTSKQVTSGYYSDQNPTFDPEGKYLFFSTNRHFSPVYSDMQNSFVYNNSTRLVAVSLTKNTPSPLAARNDAVEIKDEDKKDEENKEDEKDEGKKKGKKRKKGEDKKDEKKKDEDEVKIDFTDFERRIIILPPKAGNYGRLTAAKGKLIYSHYPNTGSGNNSASIKYYDLKEREEKTIMADAGFYKLAANGEKLLVSAKGKYAVIDIGPDKKMDKTLRTGEMEMTIVPREEWKQIFTDAWRFERDYFYDKNMHGVDWNKMREQYGALVEQAVTRGDVNVIIGDLIGELNASHTYRWGGDMKQSKRRNVGYLGIDWEIENGHYKVAKIIRGAPWDAEMRSPLDMPGIDVREGDYILAVNGMPLDVDKEPYAAFSGLAGKTVELKVNRYLNITDSVKTVIVKTLRSENRLRHLAWIEKNRSRVDEASNGRIGYVYVRNTGVDGQNELMRQFIAQQHKDGLIIDERFNGGGQIPDRFIELLNRKPLAYWAVRDGRNWDWPPAGHFGPKAMLINGWSGSGGDAFPDYFRKSKLGPVIGMRTWGGLIGLTGGPSLIDGGGVTIPTFRMYHPDGTWFEEGHGVDPDIEVVEDPTPLAKGIDPQLERAITEVMQSLKTWPEKPKQPAYEER